MATLRAARGDSPMKKPKPKKGPKNLLLTPLSLPILRAL
jgi:hypothetical protein